MGTSEMKVDTGSSGIKSINVEMPGNSNKQKKVKKVVSGKASKKKKGLGQKFSETFLGDDLDSVISYGINDIIIPAAKNALSDFVANGIERLLFGENAKGRRSSRGNTGSYVSYQNFYKGDRQGSRQSTIRSRVAHDFEDILLQDRGEAEVVLDHLVGIVHEYGQATVADLYDLVGITSTFADNKYGWTNLSQASVQRVRHGYTLKLPRTQGLS